MTRTVRVAVVAAVLLFLRLGLAQAQQNPPPAFTTFQLNSWTLSPAIHGQQVKGFLAVLDSGSAVGSNISVVWYQREADESWSTWGWPSYDVTDAVRYVRGMFNDNEIFEQDPILSEAAWGTATGDVPKQVINGLFWDDPVQPLVQAVPDPQELLSTLVEVGWEAAPDLSPLAVSSPLVCEENQVPQDPVKALMDDLGNKAELTLFGSSTFNLLCEYIPCSGCQKIYDGKTPAPGSVWVFHSRILQANNAYLCFYDRSARQYWRETGVSYLFCNQCNSTGYITTTMHAQTLSAVGDSDCHPPAN